MSVLSSKKILIVDDMASLRTELRSILESMGFKDITEMPDGKAAFHEALDKSQFGAPYEFIFSDINMPNLNGLGLLKKIRSIDAYKSIPFFLVSTENEKSIIIKAILEGATDYIIKPYDAATVVGKVNTCLTKLKLI